MKRAALLQMIEIGKHQDVGYNADLKETLLRLERQYLNDLVKALGLARGEYEIRCCKGGIAVAGEMILHTDWLYVQLSQSLCLAENALLYRTVTSRKDYTGGPNQWMRWDSLADMDAVARTLLRLKPGALRQAA